MSKKALLLAVLFVLVVLPGTAQAASAVASGTFAHAWNKYSAQERSSFIFGLGTAVRMICTDISAAQKNATPQTIEKTFRDCFNAYVGVDPEKIIATMNTLYADPQNSMIPLDGMYKISLMKLRGDKIDNVLVQSRKYGAKLKKELDERRAKGQ